MKKKMIKCAVLAPLFGILTNCHSQNDSVPKSSHQNRHEIGVNLTPALSLLMGSSVRSGRFQLSYKYLINNKSSLRASIGMDFTNYSRRIIDYQIRPEGYPINYISRSPFLRLGYERYFGEVGKLKFFYGADLIGSLYKSSLSFDSGAGSLYSNNHYVYKQTGYSIGISPFIGFTYQATKHLGFSFQSGYDFTYQLGKANSGGNVTYNTRQWNVSKPPGFFNTITINYKF